MIKKQKGITLIALVITIIVLLILAGISISLVVGKNGILEQAQNAVSSHKAGTAKEEVGFAWSSCQTEYMKESASNQGVDKSSFFTTEKLNANLGGKGTASNVIYSETGDSTLTYLPTDGNLAYNMKITSDGQIIIVGEPTVPEETVAPSGQTLASQITSANYGDYVSGYGIDLGIATKGLAFSDGKIPVTDWRIFYKDSSNVYLIASDYLPTSKYPSNVFGGNNGKYNGYWSSNGSNIKNLTTSGTVTSNNNFLFTKLSNVDNTNANYKAVATLLDSSKWSSLANTAFVDNTSTSVIGSPTVEMWMASWNQKYTDTLAFDANIWGYNVGLTEGSLSKYIDGSEMQAKQGFKDSLYYPHGNTIEDLWNSWNDCSGYWLASPSVAGSYDVLFVDYYGDVLGGAYYSNFKYGVRPVVSLSSGIKGTATTTDGITTWNISK